MLITTPWLPGLLNAVKPFVDPGEATALIESEDHSIRRYMNSKKSIPLEKRIIFALDVESAEEAKVWVKRLESHIKFFKVGLQLFLAGGFPIIDWIRDRDLEVMVDLKFFDVPQTVASAVRQLREHKATFATVHGNDRILEAAVENKNDVKILAVTVLTSLDQADIQDMGFQCLVEDLVLARAKRALKIGCDGVISSGLEAPLLRRDLGERFVVVVPGIRPVENQDDQKRVVDVGTAFKNGADYVVIGRPIRLAADPLAAVEKMQQETIRALP
jgi:orotidine-5'-phosphate decarboxylase